MAPSLRIDPAREEAELRAYLGDAYDHARLVRYEEQLDDEFARVGDERRFYRTSEAYLYNLTAFAMTRTKEPYLRELVRHCPPPARVLDYGCGIGSDGLALLEAGYEVSFADYANPSTRYLRWRLSARGLEAPLYDIEDPRGVPGGFDAAFAFDVAEHVDDPFALLGELELRARLVVVNFLAPEPQDTPLHRELPVGRLLAHAAARGLRGYHRYHGRAHLVLYSPGAAEPGDRVRARWALWRGRLATAVGGGRGR